MSVSTLRKSNTLDKLLAQVQSESAPQEKKSYVDERLWKPELDKSGTGHIHTTINVQKERIKELRARVHD